ncbi:MAG TPA: histidinol-phosphate transaminase [Opitutaceae bacterium]|nr:histidinol-phosphate transaminase [Opitutaceae bacterium]
MDAARFAQPQILNQPVYQPGKPIAQVAREFGLDPARVDKLASNENPLGPSPKAMAAAAAAVREVNLYPDGACWDLTAKLAERLGVGRDQLVFGNGSNEVLELAARVFLGPGTEAVMGATSFVVYKLATLLVGARAVEVPMPDFRHDLAAVRAAVTPRTRVVFLDCPDNPTGTANGGAELVAFARDLPENVLFVLDQAYAEYQERAPDLRPVIAEGRPVLCTRTFSKIYGLAGLRVGYGYTRPDIAALLQRARAPFNVNAVAQAAAVAALDDADFVRRSRETNRAGMAQLTAGFRALGLEWVPSEANFILVTVPEPAKAFTFLEARGTIVRPFANLARHVRITIGTAAQNERCLDNLKAWLAARG